MMRLLFLLLLLAGCSPLSKRPSSSEPTWESNPQKKVVSLHLFAASWCAECVHELRALSTYQKRNPALQLTVYLLEDSKESRNRLKDEVDLPLLFDETDGLRQTLKIRSIPKALLFDCTGKLRKIVDPHPQPGDGQPYQLRSTASFAHESGIGLIESLLAESSCQ